MPEIRTGMVIVSWYTSNIGVILLNKYLLSIYGFKFPFFLTMCHMLSCSLMSYILSSVGFFPMARLTSRRQGLKIALLAMVFCVTVVLGNVSLRFIPVSFNQAIGATTPVFTAALVAVMLRKRESRGVYLSLAPIVMGIVVASGAEPMFHVLGFAAAVTATAARAFKSVLQGSMLDDVSERMDSLSLLGYMSPIALLALIPATAVCEPQALSIARALGQASPGLRGFWALMAFNSFLAYFVNLTNFLVTKHTSALTLQVLGNAKGVVAVVVSILYFRNPVNRFTVLGYAVTVLGVLLYSRAKRSAAVQTQLRALSKPSMPELLVTVDHSGRMDSTISVLEGNLPSRQRVVSVV
ncbi:hypothetical protein H632_c243p2 [Helicosporidium sp. ATCC 50920]|nr:hypothetical protein H632_c243p2 [Helicosporidium sp. ATCC 50920]|eukprot:KDD76392.1 hypothetical protein H632_c243p2 [Helicosporidium sp. ATCC 50920]